ncbi:MAG: hypothetical protein NTZ16_03390 [Verrucomicrobia bacterium]|nr:hypothetical protein [Verrucomicrobiota bacterium]
MQKDPVIAFLAGAVCLAAFGVFVLTMSCEARFRQLRTIQPRVASIQVTQNLITGLANEVMEYSKHNPAIDPLLQQVGLKPGKVAPAAAKPAAKPAK